LSAIAKSEDVAEKEPFIKTGFGASLARFIREKPLGTAGAIIFLVAILVAIFAPLISPYNPNSPDIFMRLQSPSAQHLLGTDELGRDILSRILWGARISMLIGVVSTLIGTVVGATIGIISGYAGGKTDMIIQRFMDMLMAFPPLVLVLAMMAALGPSVLNVIIAITIPMMAPANRVSRSVTLSVKELQHIEAVKALGARPFRVIFRHVVPNALPSYIIVATSMLGGVILVEASLSFLGMGVPPPNPSWGRSLNEAMNWIYSTPLLAVWPGLAITLVVFGVNVFGDALRDILDPRLKRL
jgi:peptide/nickel transport system permease protein